MIEAEEQMKQYLKQKTLKWLREQVNDKTPEEHAKETIEWFNNPRYKELFKHGSSDSVMSVRGEEIENKSISI